MRVSYVRRNRKLLNRLRVRDAWRRWNIRTNHSPVPLQKDGVYDV